MDLSKSLAIRVLHRLIVIVGILTSTALTPVFLAVSPIPTVDLIQAEEILHFCYDIHAGGAPLSLIVINCFDPDLCELRVT